VSSNLTPSAILLFAFARCLLQAAVMPVGIGYEIMMRTAKSLMASASASVACGLSPKAPNELFHIQKQQY
jgi:hypothetical protein